MDRAQRLGRTAERMTARNNNARLTPQSGSGATRKNDSRNGGWSFEDKSTSRITYSLNRDVLATAEKHAMSDGRRMALVVTFFLKAAVPGLCRRYVVTTEEDWLEREAYIQKLESKIEGGC